MNRIEIINSLIEKKGYKKYLEVGIHTAECFNAIICEEKTGVDPDLSTPATIHLTSDEAFKIFKEKNEKFDIIFLDGLHHADTVERDVLNSLDCLNEGGAIVCHDMLPTSKHIQEIPLTDQNEWTGDCWRAFLKLRTEREDLFMATANTDWGCGIIQIGTQEKVILNKSIDDVTYEEFDANKNSWMNVISPDEFKSIYL